MRELLAKHLALVAWAVSFLVAAIAFTAWGQGIQWQFSNLSTYKIFPVFGLLAFSLIWSVYLVAFLSRHFRSTNKNLEVYYNVLSVVIFSVILLHPGLLWWQLWRDGFGLPPGSYLVHYVAASLRWAAILGTTALLIYILYEFRYKYRTRDWWKYMEYMADLVLVGLFFHALALGGQLRHGWFRYLWYFYGLVLIFILIDLYRSKFMHKKPI